MLGFDSDGVIPEQKEMATVKYILLGTAAAENTFKTLILNYVRLSLKIVSEHSFIVLILFYY